MTNEERQQMLDTLERAYYSGTSEVTIGGQTVKYANMDALWTAILRLRSQMGDESALAGGGGRSQAVAGRGYAK